MDGRNGDGEESSARTHIHNSSSSNSEECFQDLFTSLSKNHQSYTDKQRAAFIRARAPE